MTATGVPTVCESCGSALAPGPYCGACGSPVRSFGGPATAPAPVLSSAPVAPMLGTPGARWAPLADGPLAGRTPASPGRRVGAYFIDGACGGAVVLLANAVFYAQLNSAILSGSTSSFDSAAKGAFFGPLAILLIGGLLMVAVEGATGATIGNAVLKIRTVSVATGRPAGFGRAFGRRFIEQLGSVVVLGGPLIAASSAWDTTALRQGWQDRVAGTTMIDAGPRPVAPGSGGSVPAVRPMPAVPFEDLRPDFADLMIPAWEPPPAPEPTGVVTSLPSRPAGGLIADVPGFISELLTTPVVAATAPVAMDDLDDDLEHTRMAPPRARAASGVRLVFDTGENVVVTGLGLVGRNPAPNSGERVEHLIPITDPDRSVSKTHLAFGPGPEGFWVCDRESTNGTRVIVGGGQPHEAPFDARLYVPLGGTVEFGERHFTVTTP